MVESAGFFAGLGPDPDPHQLRALGMPRLAAMAPHLLGRDVGADFDAGLQVVIRGALGGGRRAQHLSQHLQGDEGGDAHEGEPGDEAGPLVHV
jgi:hypothetical protein